MIVIFDGPRGAGKTTLANKLLAELNQLGLDAEIFKHTRPEDPFVDMWQALNEFRANRDKIFICDRFVLTEYVFSIYLERMQPYDLTAKTVSILTALNMIDAIHFSIMADLDVIEKRLEERPRERRWDMPRDLVWPLWRAASGLDRDVIMAKNNNHVDADAIIKSVIRNLA